jgi:hypothetical protein
MKFPITLKRPHFSLTGRCCMSPGFVSDGRWAIRKGLVANNPVFESEATIKAAFPSLTNVSTYTDEQVQSLFDKAEYGDVHPLVDTEVRVVCHLSGNTDALARVYTTNGGNLCLFDNKYLDLFGLDASTKATGSGEGTSPAIFADCLLLSPINADVLLTRFTPLLPALENLVTDGKRFATDQERTQDLMIASNRLTSSLQAVHEQLDELRRKMPIMA